MICCHWIWMVFSALMAWLHPWGWKRCLTGMMVTNREPLRSGTTVLSQCGHPIMPVFLEDAHLAKNMANLLLEKGIFVMGFSYPVVPKGLARIRVQMSAAHSPEQVQHAVDAFTMAGKELGAI